MRIDTDFPDHLRPLLARLRATGLYTGDDGTVVCQLAIRSLRDLFEKPLIVEGAPAPTTRKEPAPPACEPEIEEIDEAPVIDPARVLHTMRKLDAEEDADEQAAGQWVRPGKLTDVQASVHKVLFDAAGERLPMREIARRAGASPGSITFVLLALDKKGLAENAGRSGLPHWVLRNAAGAAAPVSVVLHGKKMPGRRFTDVKPLDPENVNGLAADHPAVSEGRTLFPTTVVEPEDSPRLLVSGANSRKIGDRVVKGEWSGMPIYTLTLEERASCPKTCFHWRTCFGNGMPLARRHRHGPELIDYLRGELTDLQEEHPKGFVVRLHVLGDFWSVGYVEAWAQFLAAFPALRVFGYTAHPRGSEIGAEIKRLTDTQWDRFAIRFSDAEPKPQGATTIFRKAEGDNVSEGIVCPAQTGKTDCCGTCGLCWSDAAKDKTIVFMAHGRIGGKPGPRKPLPLPAPAAAPRPLTRAARIAEQAKAFSSPRKPATSDDPAVKEWLAKNGGPRTFEPGASADIFNVRLFLKDRGVDVVQKGIGNQAAYHVDGKKFGYLGLLHLANKYRAAEGLALLSIPERLSEGTAV